MRRFILVTVTKSKPGAADREYSGIKKLKRGVDNLEFIREYLQQFNLLDHVETFSRGDSWVCISRAEGEVTQWAFTEFKEEDLMTYVSKLTREELLRDLKELLPLKDIQRK